MKVRWFLIADILAFGAAGMEIRTDNAIFTLDEKNGSIALVQDLAGHPLIRSTENYYTVMSSAGDIAEKEQNDTVMQQFRDDKTIGFKCMNSALPNLEIVKSYFPDGAYLRRKLLFHNKSNAKLYLTPATEIVFDSEFRRDSYYLGAGYVGPLIPAPQLKNPETVSRFYQTTKGMILSNQSEKGSFAHYRLTLNDTFVFPWWQSTITTYCEKPNMLLYTPDGWRMALGTVDLEVGGEFSITDTMCFFNGNWFSFFDRVYGGDPIVRKELDSIGPVPPSLANIRLVTASPTERELKRLLALTDEGDIMVMVGRVIGDWADYRYRDGANGFFGGYATGEELKRFITSLKALSPRIKVSVYSWMTSVGIDSPLWKEHPEWFKRYDRTGNESFLFPNSTPNYASMINRKPCFEFMRDQLFNMSEYLGCDYIYLDEAKTTNFINWQSGEVVRDDHWYGLWKAMKERSVRDGGKLPLFFNARGNPYGDINYIEAYHQLEPRFWREFAGMGLGVESFLTLRPGARIVPLYWTNKVDYATRLLALGWIPAIEFGELNGLAVIRAAYETGDATPIDPEYSPDWKRDPSTEVESYAVRRVGCSDILISVINRGSHKADIPFSINLGTLGFYPEARINIWGTAIDSAGRPPIADRTLREYYRKDYIRRDMITSPQLLYSGPVSKPFKYNISNLDVDKLFQFVITASPAAVYSVGDLTQNYFYTKLHGVTIKGADFPLSIENTRNESCEILLADTEAGFSDIRMGNDAAVTRSVGINGRGFTIVNIPAGKHQLTAVRCNVPANSEPAAIAATPLPISDAMKIDVIARHPAVRKIEVVGRSLDNGVRLERSATLLGEAVETMNLQRDIPPRFAEAFPDRLKLRAGQSRKIEDYLGLAFAGFEFSGVKSLRLKLENSFWNAATIEGTRHVETYRRSPREFAGFVVDYRENGNYTKRVAFSCGVLSPKAANPMPDWGKNSIPDLWIDLGDLLKFPAKTFSLNLAKYAPDHWDGTIFFSLGTDYVKPGRALSTTIIGFNDAAGNDFLEGRNAAAFASEFRAPKSVDVPFSERAPESAAKMNPAEWRTDFASVGKFYLLGGEGYPKLGTECWLLFDKENLYVAFSCKESRSQTITNQSAIWQDDSVELWFRRPSGILFQVIANATGNMMALENGHEVKDTNIVVQSRSFSGGYYLFLTIPFSQIGWNPKAGADTLEANFCRNRLPGAGIGAENSTWGTAIYRYNEPGAFGKLKFSLSFESKRVKNLGKPGHSSEELLKYRLPEALKQNPDLAIILIGTNDMVNSGKLATPEAYRKNLEQIVARLKKNGTQVLLCSIPPCSEKLLFMRHKKEAFGTFLPSDRIKECNRLIREVAAEQKCQLVDFYALVAASGDPDTAGSLLRNPANSGAADGVHPTAAGNKVLAEAVFKAIIDNNLPSKNVVCIGDSITAGTGVSAGQSYPALLAGLLEQQ